MQIIKYIYIFLGLLMGTGCSNVKLALYDNEKRQEVAIETKKAFSNSDAGKEIALKTAMVETAQKYEGTTYKYGSIDPKKGFDCSGLVYYVASKQKIELPRSSSSLAASAPHIPWKKAVPGDLVFLAIMEVSIMWPSSPRTRMMNSGSSIARSTKVSTAKMC